MKSATKTQPTPRTSLGKRDTVLVTGAGGQLGLAVVAALTQLTGCRIITAPRSALDITVTGAIDAFLAEAEPTVVINCAAYNEVAEADLHPERAWLANVLGVGNLAKFCARTGATLFHVSSDFVFGRCGRREPYHEYDPVGPVNNYGWSKVGGEYEVLRQVADQPFPYYIIRTAGVFELPNPERDVSFLAKIATATKTRQIEVISDVETNITRATDLAHAIVDIMLFRGATPHGLYHVVNPGTMTWYDIAQQVSHNLGHYPVKPVAKATFRQQLGLAVGMAPDFTCLDISRYQDLCHYSMPLVTVAIKEWCATYKMVTV